MKKILFLLVVLISVASYGQPSIGAVNLAQKYAESANQPMVQMIATQLRGADAQTIKVFSASFLGATTQFFAGEYDKQFSQAELQQANDFLSTAAGKKLFAANAEFVGKISSDPSTVRRLIALSCDDSRARLSAEQMAPLKSRFSC